MRTAGLATASKAEWKREWEAKWSDLPPDPRSKETAFDFYRCDKCRAIISALEERLFLSKQENAEICECGSNRYSPANPGGRPPDLEPGEGAALTLEEASMLFEAAMAEATREWRKKNVRQMAWMRYRGLA